MSFSDLMSSSRGPGVIGLLLALVVLFGFGGLYFLVFDEGMQGGGQTVESVIREQSREIDTIKAEITQRGSQLSVGEARTATAKEHQLLARENQFRTGTLDGLKKDVAKAAERIAALEADFSAYKDQYRQFSRGRAKGEKIELLTTRDGTEYHDVTIREVTAVGMQIVHRDGQKRVPFESLSDELQDRFQFDPEQKQLALAAEASEQAAHEARTAAAVAVQDTKMAEQKEQRIAEEKAKLEEEIRVKEARVTAITSEIQAIEGEISDAQSQAAAARAAGRQFIDRSGGLRSKLRSKQNEQNRLRGEIAALRAKL